MQWHVAKTKIGQDQIALDNLKRQEFDSYYPITTIVRPYRGRIVEATEGLFPGYVFVKFSRLDDQWRIINSTRGVQRLLSFSIAEYPPAFPWRSGKAKEQEKQDKLDRSLRIGDRVRLKSGSLFPHRQGDSDSR
jgi:transcription antitermination factor NusG